MVEIQFLADENFDNRVVSTLLELGIKVSTVVESNSGIDDEAVLELANKKNAIILTEDKDFGELTFRLEKKSPGIVLVRLSGVDIGRKVELVTRVILNYATELKGAFTVITEEKVRIREL